MHPSQQSISESDRDQASKFDLGLTESSATCSSNGTGGGSGTMLDIIGLTLSRPGTPMGSGSRTPSSTLTLMSGIGNIGVMQQKNKNEVVINHKTKVSQVKPLRRIAYEWEWDITKFDKAFPPLLPTGADPAGKTKILKSEKLSAGAEIGRKSDWKFVLSENAGRLNWHIVLSKVQRGQGQPAINAAATLRIMDKNGHQLLHKARCFYDFGEHFKFGWNNIIDLNALYAEKHRLLADNTLRIRVLFEMFADTAARDIESAQQIRDDFAKIVTYDLNRLRTETGTADVHLECEGKVFPVHKLILSARSTAFARMFEATLPKPTASGSHQKSSTASGDSPPDSGLMIAVVSIPEVESHILEIILDYIYSGNVKFALADQTTTIPQTLCGVIQAADKFELRDLKAHCFNVLMNFLSNDNIGQITVLAYRHQADKNVRMNINAFCLRNLTTLMKTRVFRDALKLEPDAFFAEDECL